MGAGEGAANCILRELIGRLVGWASVQADGGFWMPVQGSTGAVEVDWIFSLILWISVFFFVLIVVLMVAVRRPLPAPRGARGSKPSPRHNTALEITWTVIPILIVIVIFVWGFTAYLTCRRAAGQRLRGPGHGPEVEVAVHLPQRPRGREPARAGRHAGAPGDDLRGRDPQLLRPGVPASSRTSCPAATPRSGSGRPEPGEYQIFCARVLRHEPLRHARPRWSCTRPASSRSGWRRPANFLEQACRRPRPASGCTAAARLRAVPLASTARPGIGPTLQGRLRRTRSRSRTAARVTADENYIRESILEPAGQDRRGLRAGDADLSRAGSRTRRSRRSSSTSRRSK